MLVLLTRLRSHFLTSIKYTQEVWLTAFPSKSFLLTRTTIQIIERRTIITIDLGCLPQTSLTPESPLDLQCKRSKGLPAAGTNVAGKFAHNSTRFP